MFTNPKAACGWDEYVERATKAARQTRKGGKTVANLIGNQVTLVWPCPDCLRCQFVGVRLGRRCKQYAVRGATRCRMHGGLREVPDHPANGRALLRGVISQHEETKAAKAFLYQHPLREQTYQMLVSHGLDRSPVSVKSAIEAQEADDTGQAWRKWLAVRKGKAND